MSNPVTDIQSELLSIIVSKIQGKQAMRCTSRSLRDSVNRLITNLSWKSNTRLKASPASLPLSLLHACPYITSIDLCGTSISDLDPMPLPVLERYDKTHYFIRQ